MPETEKAYKIETLAGFIAALEKAGELLRISEPVSPVLEISEICDRHSKMKDEHGAYGGKALLFENVEGSSFPVLINSMGSYRRMKSHLADGSLIKSPMRLLILFVRAST